MYDLHKPRPTHGAPSSKLGRGPVAALCALLLLCACKEQVPPPQLRAVATIPVQRRVITETATLRGVSSGRDATFDVPAQMMRAAPENPRVEVWLAEDSLVRVTGRVREVVPQADAAARMLTMKVGLENPPPTMQPGASVRSRMRLHSDNAFVLPGTALNETDGRPAVWVVDPQHQTVDLRSVEVLRFDASSTAISSGLEDGETVVAAGVHALVPRQTVRLLRSGS